MLTCAVGTETCPKCASRLLEKRLHWYPTLGHGDLELACALCGLLLWAHTGESPRHAYYRWLMERWAG